MLKALQCLGPNVKSFGPGLRPGHNRPPVAKAPHEHLPDDPPPASQDEARHPPTGGAPGSAAIKHCARSCERSLIAAGADRRVAAMYGNYATDPGRVRELVAAITSKELSPVALVRRFSIASRKRTLKCNAGVRSMPSALLPSPRSVPARPRRATSGGCCTVCRLRSRISSMSRAYRPALTAARVSPRPSQQRCRGGIGARKRRVRSFSARCTPPSTPSSIPRRLAIPTISRIRPGDRVRGRQRQWLPGWHPQRSGRRRSPRSTGRRRIAGSAHSSQARAACRHSGSPHWRPPTTHRGSTAGAWTTRRMFTRPLHRTSFRPKLVPRAPTKLAVCIPDDPHISDAVPDMKAALARMADAFARAGHAVEQPRSPISFERLFQIQRHTMAYEAGRALKYLLDQPDGTLARS